MSHHGNASCEARVRTAGDRCICCIKQIWHPSVAKRRAFGMIGIPAALVQAMDIQEPMPSAGPSAGPTQGSAPKRQRLACKQPGLIVHHLWINMGLQASLGELGLSNMANQCLMSWVPCEQWLWVYSPDLAMDHNVPANVRIMDAQDILPAAYVVAMLLGNVPIQFIKDIFSMKAIHAHGGLWTDMDILWLGRPLAQGESGYIFTVEPHTKPASQPFGRSSHRVSLAIFGLPRGAKLAKDLGDGWLQHWLQFALRQYSAPEAIDWTSWDAQKGLWMYNTRQFTMQAIAIAAIQGSAVLRVPLEFMPLGMRLKPSDWPALQQALRATEPQLAIADITYNEAFLQSSCADMAAYSCTVNLWDRQWPADLQDAVLAWAIQQRLANLPTGQPRPKAILPRKATAILPPPAVSVPPAQPKWREVQKAIQLQQLALEDVFGLPWAHDILSNTFKLLSKNVIKAIIADDGAGLPEQEPGNGGRPGKMQGLVGPWHGPRILVCHWAAELIFQAARTQSSLAKSGIARPFDVLDPKANGPEPACLALWQQQQAQGLALHMAPWLDAILKAAFDKPDAGPWQKARLRSFYNLVR